MDLAKVKINSSEIEKGAWVGELPGFDSETQFLVKGYDCLEAVAYRAEFELKLGDEYRDAKGNLKPEGFQISVIESLKNVILLGWKGIKSDGVEVAYSKEAADEYLSDPDYKVLVDAVITASNIVGKRRYKNSKVLEKN